MDLPYQSEVIRLIFYLVVWVDVNGEIFCHVFQDRNIAVTFFYEVAELVTGRKPTDYGNNYGTLDIIQEVTEETTALNKPVKFYGHYHALRVTVEDN